MTFFLELVEVSHTNMGYTMMSQSTHVYFCNYALIKIQLFEIEIHKIELSFQDTTKSIEAITPPNDGHTFISEQTIITYLTKL
jgi:hypothetical protein